MPDLKALVFDAYGTIFDVHSVVSECERVAPGKGAELSQLWRAKQLEYSWLRSLMEKYQDFRSVTESALAYACERLDVSLDLAARERLMAAYLRLDPYRDVVEALPRLAAYQLAILSNGSLSMLEPAVRNAGLANVFQQVMSVDAIRIYKPSPQVYRLPCDRFGLKPDQVGFVSSNSWDVIGAKASGLRVFWLNRTGQVLDHLGFTPDATIAKLTELAALLNR